jgi:proliferating cell nuclear antigen
MSDCDSDGEIINPNDECSFEFDSDAEEYLADDLNTTLTTLTTAEKSKEVDEKSISVSVNDSDFLLELKTSLSDILKNLFLSLKEILVEGNLVFDHSGMVLSASDRIVHVNLKLIGSEFEHYKCQQRTSAGISLINFNKLMTMIEKDDVITLYISKSEPNEIGLKRENSKRRTNVIMSLNLMDLDESLPQELNIDEDTYNTMIQIKSTHFQKIIKDMSSIANTVEITCIGKNIIFKCKGENSKSKHILTEESEDVFFIVKNEQEIVQGIFDLKFLNYFTKATTLHHLVRLYLHNNYPLFVIYSVGSLGELKFSLSAKVREYVD